MNKSVESQLVTTRSSNTALPLTTKVKRRQSLKGPEVFKSFQNPKKVRKSKSQYILEIQSQIFLTWSRFVPKIEQFDETRFDESKIMS